MELIELIPELVELVFFGLSTAVLSLAGTYLERFAYITLQSGNQTIGTWAAVMGAVILAFAYFLGTDKFITKIQDFKRQTDDFSAE